MALTNISLNAEPQHGLSSEENTETIPAPWIQKATSRTFQDLKIQSDVDTDPQPHSRLLVDCQDHANNYELWLELLEFRERLYGDPGVRQVWRGMHRRHVNLPTSGAVADRIWTCLLAVAARDGDIRDQLWCHAKSLLEATSTYWHSFSTAYLSIILEKEPQNAFDWFKCLQKLHLTNELKLRDLLNPAIHSQDGLHALKQIYNHHTDRRLYDQIIRMLVFRGFLAEAYAWHRFLVNHGDLPLTGGSVEQVVASTTKTSGRSSLHKALSKNSTRGADAFPSILELPAIQSQPPPTADNEIRVFNESLSKRRQPVTDSFAARAFATRAFSVTIIITGLLSFGFNRIGALAMRELAVRCNTSVKELNQHLCRLEESGVILDGRVFTKVIRKIALDQNQQLLDAVLENDQHPDVYDDQPLQDKLLVQYIAQANWKQVNRTLTVLTIFHRQAPVEAWNTVLQEFIKARSWKMVDLIVNDMLAQSIKIKAKSIKYPYFYLLGPRRPGHGPVHKTSPFELDDLVYVTRLLLKILRQQGGVSVMTWKGILTYYGTAGRLAELENLCLTLAEVYSRNLPTAKYKRSATPRLKGTRRRSSHLVTTSLSNLFQPAMQRAMVEWGFITLGKPSWAPKRRLLLRQLRNSAKDVDGNVLDGKRDWDFGLNLLRMLNRRGLVISDAAVRAACRTRLTILFGSGQSKKAVNRIAASQNPFTARQMVTRIHHIMGKNVLRLPASALQHGDVSGIIGGRRRVMEIANNAQANE